MFFAVGRVLPRPIICLGLLAVLTGLLVSTGSLNSTDTARRLQVSEWLWQDTKQVRDDDRGDRSFVVIGRDQKPFVTWGIGQSLVMLPADILAGELTRLLHLGRSADKIRAAVVAYMTFPAINAVAVMLAFRMLTLLGYGERLSVYGSLGLLFGTTFLPYAQSQQENSLLFMLLLAGFACSLAWIKEGSRFLLAVGVCSLGLGLLVRIPSILDAAAVYGFTVAILVQQSMTTGQNIRDLWRRLLECTVIFSVFYGVFIILDRVYNWVRFGSFTETYTSLWAQQMRTLDPSLPANFPFSTPFLTGFEGFLFSADRSIFLFNPLLIVVGGLLVVYWREIPFVVRGFAVALIALLLGDICAYAKWFLWGGAGSWGPRYTTGPSQALSMLAIPLAIVLWPSIRIFAARLAIVLVTLLSVVIQISSVIYDFNLELAQLATFPQDSLIVWRRIVNLAALATGNFAKWGLVPTLQQSELEKFTTLAFLPWRQAGELPPHVSQWLQAAWWCGLAIAIAMSILLLLATGSGSYLRTSAGSSSKTAVPPPVV